MKTILKLLPLAGLVLLTSCSKQEQATPGDSTHATAAAVKSGDGLAIVRGVDTAAKSITLAHGDVPGIMDAMLMEYPVSNPAMLHTVAVGDSVSFTLQDRGDGNYVVTKISLIKKG